MHMGGGTLSRAAVPWDLMKILNDGSFRGKVMHSTEVGDGFLGSDRLRGRRILMVGDSSSAEDLTLQALKMGAERVYIASAMGAGISGWTTSWPGDRVWVLRCLPKMMMRNHHQRLDELDVPYLRKDLDEAYGAALLQSLPGERSGTSIPARSGHCTQGDRHFAQGLLDGPG